MAGVNPARLSRFLQKGGEEEEEGGGGGGAVQPKEEAAEEPTLPGLPQSFPRTVQEEISAVFGPTKRTGGAAGSRRKRAKSGRPEGGGGTLYADRRKSKVWNYYTKLGDAYVECTVCKKQLSFHNSTTTMREHLVRKHSLRHTFLAQLKDDSPSELDSAVRENDGRRDRRQTATENGLYVAGSCSEPKSDVILELVVEMIFRDLHPLSVVTEKGFGLLLGFLEPGFALPSPARLSGVLRHRYGVAKQRLERYVRTAEAVTVCAEFWFSRLGQTYLTVAVDFVDGEWRRARCLVETQPVSEEGPEGDLGEKLYAVLSRLGLSGESVRCVVHDSPRNAAARGRRLKAGYGWSSLCCAARGLQLCVQAGLEVEPVREALNVARGVVRYFQEDAVASGSLKRKLEALNKSGLTLVPDASSRWMSTLAMCESLLELKWAIMAVLEEHPEGPAAVRNLADHQWKLLQDLLPVLRTVEIATAFLREEQNVAVSSLMPCLHGIVAAVGRQSEEAGAAVQEAAGAIRSELTRRWGLEEEEKVLESPAVIASFLDPRFKELRFLSPGRRSELHRQVKATLSQVFGHQVSPAAPIWGPDAELKTGGEDAGNQPVARKSRCPSAAAQSVYDILLGKDPTESMPEIHRQLENYIVEPLCKRSTDPLDWWKSNEHRFPAVARLSRQYLAIPTTVVPAGQAFAVGESTLEHRRAVLPPENLDQILFLHRNFDFLESIRTGKEPQARNPR